MKNQLWVHHAEARGSLLNGKEIQDQALVDKRVQHFIGDKEIKKEIKSLFRKIG